MRLYEFLVAAAVCGLNKPWSGAEAHRGSVAVTPKRARNQTSKRAAIQTIRNVNISLVISTNRHEEVRSYIRRLFSQKILKRRCALANATPNQRAYWAPFFFLFIYQEGILSREGGGFSPPMRSWWFHPPRLCGCGTQHPVATNTQLGRTFRPLRSFSGAPVMVGMFFSDGVLVAGVAVGRRGPLSFFWKKVYNEFI